MRKAFVNPRSVPQQSQESGYSNAKARSPYRASASGSESRSHYEGGDGDESEGNYESGANLSSKRNSRADKML